MNQISFSGLCDKMITARKNGNRRVVMGRNKTRIMITSINDHGRSHNLFCESVLMLRKARQVGDIEVVNNTQLGCLKRNSNEVQFEVLD